MTMLNKAWVSIPGRTFLNCFKKSGISEESVEKALNDEDDTFTNLDVEEEVIENLQGYFQVIKEKFDVNFVWINRR